MRQNTIIIHSLDNSEVREVEKNGKKFLVSPVVAVQEQVLNGQLALEEELSAYVDAWNDTPIVVGHPVRRGQKVSAKHQEIVESESVGRFYNVNWDEGKLKGEIWVDVEKAETLAENNDEIADALEKLRNNKAMDVSTAYFSDVEQTEGTYNGIKYNGIQRNIRPDHLALLPNQTGACSLADGCGTPKVNFLQEEETDEENENTIMNKLNKIMDLFKKNIKDGDDKLAEKEELITKIAEYECNSFSEDELEAKEMDELEVYEGLLALNCKEDEPETNEDEETDEEVDTNEEEEGEDMTEQIKNFFENELEMSVEDFKEIKANIESEKKAQKEKRDALAEDIVDNADLDMTEDDLEGMKINALEKLADAKVVANYSGRAAPKVDTNDEDMSTYEAPGLLLENKKDGDE